MAKPSVSRDAAKSLVTSSFKTNKIDIGAVMPRTVSVVVGQDYWGYNITEDRTYYSYSYANVKDLDANVYIYQEEAIEGGMPMDVAATKKIFPVTVDGKRYFAFGNGTYFAESPTQVYSQTGLTYPVGFRVVGAAFTPQWGSEISSSQESHAIRYITYADRRTTYYLNDQLRFTTTPFGWYYDTSTGAIFTGRGDNVRYLACEGTGGTRTLSFSSAPPSSDSNDPGYYDIVFFTRGNTNYVGWDANSSYNRWYLQGTTSSTTVPTVTQSTTNAANWTSGGTETVTLPAFTPGAYTLTVYDKTGNSVVGTASVSNASQAGQTIDLTDKDLGYNNDAVKFEISGLPDGCQALVDVSLFMQALNPYIDQMNLVCHDNADQLSLAQSFTAENFMISGGTFKFYVPTEYSEDDLSFTFSDLYSQYGDDTYYTGTSLQQDGYARYSFVTSPYFQPINGNGNDGLYSATYSPDAPYTDKVTASETGNIRFKFNNAEDLNSESGKTERSYLEEYPFSVEKYVGSDDPDGSSEKGAFNVCTLNAQSTKSDVYYLFTADETRYNIAPSKAWQHRYYAFYRMDISLETHTYDPKLTWTKVYDHSCYVKDGKDTDASMWGLKLGTVEQNTQTEVTGYLTVKQIDDAIAARTADDNAAPKETSQILYIDGSDLYSIINVASTDETTGETQTMTLSDLKEKLAKNVLIYLPANTSSTLDNFAYKPSGWATGGAFRAGRDIVLTDKQPFYAPYDIQVDIDNKATYSREVTWAIYGATTKQSLILPFNLAASGGTYSGSSTFNVTQLTGNDLTDDADKNYVTATFSTISGNEAVANTPYLVDISTPSDGTFEVVQGGATIKATTVANGLNTGDSMFYGEEVNATYTGDGSTHTFKPMGSFAGKIFEDAEFRTSNVFFYYASDDKFRSSAELNTIYHQLFAYPFRSFYGYSTAGGSKLAAFLIGFGEETDGISDITKRIDFAVRSGKGYLQITSGKDATVRINGLNGVQVATEQMAAGDTRTIDLPSGIYIVNGMKVIVK